jgi:threonine dehydratase
MPEDAPRAKVAATGEYGAEVIFYDRQRDDRERSRATWRNARGSCSSRPTTIIT